MCPVFTEGLECNHMTLMGQYKSKTIDLRTFHLTKYSQLLTAVLQVKWRTAVCSNTIKSHDLNICHQLSLKSLQLLLNSDSPISKEISNQ